MELDGGQGRVRVVCHGPTGDEPTRSFQGVGLLESSTPRASAAIRGAVLWACGEQMEGELRSQGDPGSHLFPVDSLRNPARVVHFSVLPPFRRL